MNPVRNKKSEIFADAPKASRISNGTKKRHPLVQQDINRIAGLIKKEAKDFEGKTILISGGFGFLGSYFLGVFERLNEKVLKKPCRIISVDNYITSQKDNILGDFSDKNLFSKQHDITKPIKIKEPVDYIIHAAGIASPVYYMKYPLETIEVASSGTKNLLELARQKKVKSFLFFSSSEIYGDPDPKFIPTPETYRGNVSSTGPRACYDESKRIGETLCLVYHRLYNLPIKIVRPFNVYGPGMRPDDHRVMPKFLTNALRSEALPVHGSGRQTRTYCYISDAITGFIKILLSKKEGEVYNIGNDKNEINLLQLAKLVAELFHHKIKVARIPYPAGYPGDEPNRRCPNIAKARKNLGYKPLVDVRTGLARLIIWYRDSYKFTPTTHV